MAADVKVKLPLFIGHLKIVNHEKAGKIHG
jgi:hypothetical protein